MSQPFSIFLRFYIPSSALDSSTSPDSSIQQVTPSPSQLKPTTPTCTTTGNPPCTPPINAIPSELLTTWITETTLQTITVGPASTSTSTLPPDYVPPATTFAPSAPGEKHAVTVPLVSAVVGGVVFVAAALGVAAWWKTKRRERRERSSRCKAYGVRCYCETDMKLDEAREMSPRIAAREKAVGENTR